MQDEQLGFGFIDHLRDQRTTPDPETVRIDALDLLAQARAATAEGPWDAAKVKLNRIIYPHLVSWLPSEEAEQLRFEFLKELDRIEALLAA